MASAVTETEIEIAGEAPRPEEDAGRSRGPGHTPLIDVGGIRANC